MRQSVQSLFRIIEEHWQTIIQNGIPAGALRDQVPSAAVPPATATDKGGVVLSNTAPLANGTAAAGTGSAVSRSDHIHPREHYICIWEQQSAGTDGGTFTNGAWRTRVLTTEHADTGGHATLASNQITLLAGTYRTLIHAPASNVGKHKARLRNITGSATLLVGGSAEAPAPSIIQGRFTLAGSTILEVQHQCQTTQATTGLGAATNVGEIEIFTTVEFWREA